MRNADLILLDAVVHTLDTDRPRASALAITGGRISAVGDAKDVTALSGPRTETIDLHRRTVVPGLVDAHTHPILGLDSIAGLDLSGCTDLGQVRAALAASAATDGWITAWGLDPNAFGATPLGYAAVEDVLAGRPAYLTLFDGHAAIASRAALVRAGIDGARDFVARARIACDDDGRPTGHLIEEPAMRLVADLVPPPSLAERARQLADLLARMAAAGLTGGHVMDLHHGSLELLDMLENVGTLPLRLRLAPWCRPDDDLDGTAELVELQNRKGRLWQVAGVKLFLDGTIDAGTAWLAQPDCRGESTAPYWREPEAYATAVRRLAHAGVQTATHAIGDAAVAFVLDTLATCPGRHRIEHIETLPTDQIPRFAELGVVASMQPTHATDYTRADGSDNWSRRLGASRAARGWPCRDIADSGAILALGSDWPVAPYDPRAVMASARTRRPVADPAAAPVQPVQALTAAQALRGYTTGAAAAVRAEGSAGRIREGCHADLTVFAADPLHVDAAELPHVPVEMTIVDGIVRHRAT